MTSTRIVGSGTKLWLVAEPASTQTQKAEAGLLDFWPADQVVSVRAGTLVVELQQALAGHGQCLPLPDPAHHGLCLAGWPGTVGGLLATNLPHGHWAACGGPRDWILGATVRRADGTHAKSGSRAVKSVAGFDVHRALVGSWGKLALIESATLRTWPIRGVPPLASTQVGQIDAERAWIQRTDPSGFSSALESAPKVIAYDEPSCTIWSEDRPQMPVRGWVIGPGGERWSSGPVNPFARRLKEVLDPSGAFV